MPPKPNELDMTRSTAPSKRFQTVAEFDEAIEAVRKSCRLEFALDPTLFSQEEGLEQMIALKEAAGRVTSLARPRDPHPAPACPARATGPPACRAGGGTGSGYRSPRRWAPGAT